LLLPCPKLLLQLLLLHHLLLRVLHVLRLIRGRRGSSGSSGGRTQPLPGKSKPTQDQEVVMVVFLPPSMILLRNN
jgi:hypothetical protein